MNIYFRFQNDKSEWLASTTKEGVLAFTLDFNKSYVLEFDIDNLKSMDDICKPVNNVIKELITIGSVNKFIITVYDDKNTATNIAVFKGTMAPELSLKLTILSTEDLGNLNDILVELGNNIQGELIDLIFKNNTSSAINELFDTLGIPTTSTKINKDSSEEDIINYINTKTKATVSKPKETINDYVCNKTLKNELMEICDFFNNEKVYKSKNVIIPKGILFKGAPGTGKTYAARCIAGSVEAYFLHTTASALQGQYIGSGAENIRTLFKAARKLRDASSKGIIIFIDELDSLGNRLTHNGGASGEEDRTLNQLLAELSGFDDDERIIVMTATNYPDRLDDALMRSGRLSRQISINYPNQAERYNLVEYYFSKINLELIDTNYNEITYLTENLSPADIKEVANEAGILAIRNKRDSMLLEDINEAINKVITKNIRNEDSELDTSLVASHEAGHVLAEILYCKSYPIKVTNYSYGNAGGFTQSSIKYDGLLSNEELINKVKILLAGRAAEKILCKKETTGASNDLYKAQNILKDYYKTYIFEEYDVEKLNQLIVNKIFELYNIVVNDFKNKYDVLEKITDLLINKRVLYKSDLTAIITI